MYEASAWVSGTYAEIACDFGVYVITFLGSSRFRVGDNEHREHVSSRFDP